MSKPHDKTLTMLLSGGADSAVLLAHLRAEGYIVHALTVDYGQRHVREINAAKAVAGWYGIPHHVINASFLAGLLPGSSQTDRTVAVPHGGFEEPVMKRTVVPNRNMVLASIAAAYAHAHKHDGIALAVHGGDRAIYPDCREPWVDALERVVAVGNWDPSEPVEIDALWHSFHVRVPFLKSSKRGIIARGIELRVPFGLTWTCYEGGERACGKCGACVERADAFDWANEQRASNGLPRVADPVA